MLNGLSYRLLCLVLSYWPLFNVSAMTNVSDPFRIWLSHECQRTGWRGLAMTLTLARFYDEDDLSSCDPKQKYFADVGSIRAAKIWVSYERAILGRDLSRAHRLQRFINPLLDPAISITKSTNTAIKKIDTPKKTDHRVKSLGLISVDFIQGEEEAHFIWTLPESRHPKALTLGYRGQLSVWLDDQLLSRLPTQNSIWLDDVFITIPAHKAPSKLIIRAQAQAQFIARISNPRDREQGLLQNSLNRLDKTSSSVSDFELLSLSMIAEQTQLLESSKILPIIEADQRWFLRPSLWLNQVFTSLSPPKIRAQAWGDYPLDQALKDELTIKSARPKMIIQTHYQLLCIEEFYDHLGSGRLYEARLVLDKLKALPWLNTQLVNAQVDLYRIFDLNHSPLQLLRDIGIINFNTTPSILLEYSSLLQHIDPIQRKNLFTSAPLQAWITKHLKRTYLSPSLIQFLTQYIVDTEPNQGLWLRVLKRITQGPAGQMLWRQLYDLAIDQNHAMVQNVFLENAPTALHQLIYQHLSKVAINSFPPLGGDTPLIKDSQTSNQTIDTTASVESLYHHIHYHIDQGRLSRTERRILRPLTSIGAQSLVKLSLPHSPNRQTFNLDHVNHLRLSKQTYETLNKPKRTQRSLSDPEARLYYDLIAEELNFEDLRKEDLLDIQWSLGERTPDLEWAMPHSDLITLRDRSFKRCVIVTMDLTLQQVLKYTVDLKGLTHLDRCNQSNAEAKVIVSLSNLSPLLTSSASLQGTSVNSYVHFSNIKKWATISKLYELMLLPLMKETTSIKSTAYQWTKTIVPWDQTSQDKKRYETEVLETLLLKITQNTRYVGLEFGRHSYEPTHPEITLERQLGDCKDRAALMISLATSLNIPLAFAMVRTQNAGIINPQGVASMSSFDHAIVYSPTLKRFFDPTLPYYDPKTLPNPDYSAQTLLVNGPLTKGEKAELHTIPPPDFDHIGQRMSLSLERSETTPKQLKLYLEAYGEEAALLREAFDQKPKGLFQAQLTALYPQIMRRGYRLSLEESQRSVRDPIKLIFSKKIEDSISPHDLPKFDLSQKLSIDTSKTELTLFVPQSRQIRCITIDQQLGKIDLNSIRTQINTLPVSPHQKWSIGLNIHSSNVCLEMKLTQAQITPQEYPRFNQWIHDAEDLINQSISRLINQVL
jgi:hypothetical protein